MQKGEWKEVVKNKNYRTMNIHRLLCSILSFFCANISAQYFENEQDLKAIKIGANSQIEISKEYYKSGKKSLLWQWNGTDNTLSLKDERILLSARQFKKRAGIRVWIFNESPTKGTLQFNFLDSKGRVEYTFPFKLNYYGWRAAWMAYADMWTEEGGKTSPQSITQMEIIPSEKKGKLWIDRLSFVDYVDRQATPDAQIPENNRHLKRDIWHWGLLHQWERNQYDIPIPRELNAQDKKYLEHVIIKVKETSKGKPLNDKEQGQLSALEEKLSISDDGKRGAPLMQKNNLERGDVSLRKLAMFLDLSSRGWVNTHNKNYLNLYLKGLKYMQCQGFAYESGMGTNHHYGYDIPEIYASVWRMENELRVANLWEGAKKTVTYWSGLQETRVPYNRHRDEITDSWNTLLMPRLLCALMADTQQEQYRNLQALSRWVNGSLSYTPGTIGGIKKDGTAFHHGGHYWAYAVPGYAAIGQYLNCVNGTPFSLTPEAREVFKKALSTLQIQTNLRDWGLASAGRHPFDSIHGKINRRGVQAFAYAALSYPSTDRALAGMYLRLIKGLSLNEREKELKKLFTNQGILPALPPQGFFVFNHNAQGVYRFKNIMFSIKGVSRNIWGSELYSADNRYGRYQGYGTAQLIGTENTLGVITEKASGYKEEGWDWNRFPGVTSIQLPLEKLESPFKGSDMLNQPNTFAGATVIDSGKAGMFAMKIGEYAMPNFTPSFKAHKSIFCFGDNLIFLGTHIENDNHEYPTQTTLFQVNLEKKEEALWVNEKTIKEFPYHYENGKLTVLRDPKGYYYYVPKGQQMNIEKQHQKSRENKKKTSTEGDFAVAYINHGIAPKDGSYEYMISLQTPKSKIDSLKKGWVNYTVLQKNQGAHIVKDNLSQRVGYAIFDPYDNQQDECLLKIDAETLVMIHPLEKALHISVCAPDLNIGEYQYTTTQASQPIKKQILIKGKYKLSLPNDKVKVKPIGEGQTEVTIDCVEGIPVEFSLHKI